MSRYALKGFLCPLLTALSLALLFSCSTSFSTSDGERTGKINLDEKKKVVKPSTPMLPRDRYGVIDWSELLRRGYIAPLSTIRPDDTVADKIYYRAVVWTNEVKEKFLSENIVIPLKPLSLPENRYQRVQWSEVIRRAMDPIASIDESAPNEIEVTLKSKKGYMADVTFPHSVHTFWLDCKNCHPAIFNKKSWGLTMDKILHGEYCGRCHGKVAFPIRECYRCHMERPRPE